MATNPLPPGATGKDAMITVFDGCENKVALAGGIAAYAAGNAILAGAAGTVVGFGLTWWLARHLRAKKVI